MVVNTVHNYSLELKRMPHRADIAGPDGFNSNSLLPSPLAPFGIVFR